MHRLVPSQVQEFVFFLAELDEDPFSPFLQSVHVLLDGRTINW